MSQSLNIRIEYFARFRERAGVPSEYVNTDAVNAAALYRQIAANHGFNLSQAQLRVAVNDEFVGWDYALKNGDTVVFIPPVAGG